MEKELAALDSDDMVEASEDEDDIFDTKELINYKSNFCSKARLELI